MPIWTFYPVFIATVVSMFGLSHIAFKNRNANPPRTLSELAAAEEVLLLRFRNILLFCGILFAITVFGFVVPRITLHAVVAIFGALMIGGELLAAVIPARNTSKFAHQRAAQAMAIGMLGLGFSFWCALQKYSAVEAVLSLAMCAAGVMTFLDRARYVIYELIFIFLSHFTIAIAAIALR